MMRFLVDECTGPAVADWLRQQGHDVLSAYDKIYILRTFLDRYGDLPQCFAWTGREELGIGCDTACARGYGECGVNEAACLAMCASQPRTVVDCWRSAPDCDLSDCSVLP